ncbi:MAG TPA: hypothetical protein VM052_00735, partial [Candidatus Limnocylindrales bacterium]|nr:hypothetical protein [Candidatus Limnocylindrales bacterium]
ATDRAFPAADLGYEGVACVDDAARAIVLMLDLWESTHLAQVRAWAASLLDFVVYMQEPDGRFVNFIWDWEGRRNDRGPTSFPGGGFWHARGVRALAKAALVLGDERAAAGLAAGLPYIRDARDVPADVRSIHVLMTIELMRAGRMIEMRGELERWSDEIAALRNGDVLQDSPDSADPHLWGHVQEGVLAEAGALLERPDLIDIARRSADAYLAPIIESGFDLPTVQPYGVASAVYSVDRLAVVTGDTRFADLAHKARAWFHGRNPARRAVYDRGMGRVHDGIDEGLLNEHSGAESNVVGAQALIDEVVADAPRIFAAVRSA